MTRQLLKIEKGIVQWMKAQVVRHGAHHRGSSYRGTHEVVMLPGKEYTLVA